MGERRIALSVSVAALVLMLSGCGGGEGAAKAADERFSAVEHVTDVGTSTDHGGAPWNTGYTPFVELEPGLDDVTLAHVVDQLIVIARDELSGANVGVRFYFSGSDLSNVDLRGVVPMLGDIGDQSEGNLRGGVLDMFQADVKSYESPFGVG